MNYPIKELLPHREPFLLIDRMEEHADGPVVFRAWFTPQKDTVFHDETLGGLPAYVGVEIIAQAAGAYVGYTDREAGRPMAKSGKLLLVRDFLPRTSVLRTGEELSIEISVVMSDMPFGVFHGVMKRGEEILIETELTVHQD